MADDKCGTCGERLSVTNSVSVVTKGGKSVELPQGWRVAIDHDGGCDVLSRNDETDDCRFARRKDAEAARRALIREGLDTADALTAAGWKRVKQVMVEAMQW